MAAIIFPFTMELLVIVLFGLVALPVYVATRLLDAIEDALA
jgi:general stress protein CsbA